MQTAAEYTEEQHEAYLNDLYSDGMREDAAIESLIYLTNPKRGRHVSEKRLRAAYQNGTLGTILRSYDSIAFTVSFNDQG